MVSGKTQQGLQKKAKLDKNKASKTEATPHGEYRPRQPNIYILTHNQNGKQETMATNRQPGKSRTVQLPNIHRRKRNTDQRRSKGVHRGVHRMTKRIGQRRKNTNDRGNSTADGKTVQRRQRRRRPKQIPKEESLIQNTTTCTRNTEGKNPPKWC